MSEPFEAEVRGTPMPAAADKLAAYFEELEARDRFSGVVLLMNRDRELFAGAYGYASRSWGVRNHLRMRFDTASIAKLFTSVAVLQQVDQGRLSLQTRAVDCLGLEGTAISPDVQVHHLLTHTSGIADDAEEESGEEYADLWTAKPNYAVTEAIHFLPQFVHKPPNFAPGAGCRYCNCGYVLLGLMVEKASGLGYRDYVADKKVEPPSAPVAPAGAGAGVPGVGLVGSI